MWNLYLKFSTLKPFGTIWTVKMKTRKWFFFRNWMSLEDDFFAASILIYININFFHIKCIFHYYYYYNHQFQWAFNDKFYSHLKLCPMVHMGHGPKKIQVFLYDITKKRSEFFSGKFSSFSTIAILLMLVFFCWIF